MLSLAVATAIVGYAGWAIKSYSPVSVQVGDKTIVKSSLFFDYYETPTDAQPQVEVKPKPPVEYDYGGQAEPVPAPAPAPAKPKYDYKAPTDSIYKKEPLSEVEYQELLNLVNWTQRTYTPKDVAFKGLAPPMQHSLLGVARDFYTATGKKITVNSAYREATDQAKLKKKLSSSRQVGGINGSSHRFGTAVDFSREDAQKAEELGILAKNDMFIPRELTNEDWHAETVYNASRYSKELFNKSQMLAANGLDGQQIWVKLVMDGDLDPLNRYAQVRNAAIQWAREKRLSPSEAVTLASFTYYTETSGGLDLTSSTSIVGHFQINKKMRDKLGLRNPLDVEKSTKAALDLALANGWTSNPIANYAKHNLGLTSYNSAIEFVRYGTPLTAAARRGVYLNIPKASRKTRMSDGELVQAYNQHLKNKSDKYMRDLNHDSKSIIRASVPTSNYTGILASR